MNTEQRTLDLSRFIGVPFKEKGRDFDGWDCWGLAICFYRAQFGIELPSYTEDYKTTEDEAEIGALVRREKLAWEELPIEQAHCGDLLIMRMRGQPMHCGVVLDPPVFLHVHDGMNAVKERWDSIKWQHRIVCVLRHAAMLTKAGLIRE